MGWLLEEWSVLAERLIPAVADTTVDGPVYAAVCGSARNAVALALALRTVPPQAGDFGVFLLPAPSYSEPVCFSAAEITRLARPDHLTVLERDGRRWAPARELLERVVVGKPDRPLDLVVIGARPRVQYSAAEVLGRLRAGGRVLLQDGDGDLLEGTEFRPLDPSGHLAEKLTDAEAVDVPSEEGLPGPTLADVVDRADLIESHYPLARALARRYARHGHGLADLEQVAFAALVRAAGRYEANSQAAFSSFAAVSISGELKRHFRDRTWMLRMPRSLQESYLHVKAAHEELTQRLGASPTVAQIAEHLDVSEETVLAAMEAGDNYSPASLDAPCRNDDSQTAGVGVTDERFDRRLDLQVLAEALPRLDKSQQLIVKRVFFDGRTQRDVAGELGVSQMQVSRLLARTLASLRQALDPGWG